MLAHSESTALSSVYGNNHEDGDMLPQQQPHIASPHLTHLVSATALASYPPLEGATLPLGAHYTDSGGAIYPSTCDCLHTTLTMQSGAQVYTGPVTLGAAADPMMCDTCCNMPSPLISCDTPADSVGVTGYEEPPLLAATSPGAPLDPRAAHIVLFHIIDGERVQIQHDDCYELIQGPATVEMVSSNLSPPQPYPVQVPAGHIMQQVVDSAGTLRHVILSPEPQPPYDLVQPSHINYIAAPVDYAADTAAASHVTLATVHSPPPPALSQQLHTDTCVLSAASMDMSHTLGPPALHSHEVAPTELTPAGTTLRHTTQEGERPAASGAVYEDLRCQRRATRLRRKLIERTACQSRANGVSGDEVPRRHEEGALTESSDQCVVSPSDTQECYTDSHVQSPGTVVRGGKHTDTALATDHVSPSPRAPEASNTAAAAVTESQHAANCCALRRLTRISHINVTDITCNSALIQWAVLSDCDSADTAVSDSSVCDSVDHQPVTGQVTSSDLTCDLACCVSDTDGDILFSLFLSEQKAILNIPSTCPKARAVEDTSTHRCVVSKLSAMSYKLIDLSPHTNYHLILRSSLKCVIDHTCADTRFVTLSSVPCAPLPPTLFSRTKSSMTLKWIPPADNGSRIKLYVLEWINSTSPHARRTDIKRRPASTSEPSEDRQEPGTDEGSSEPSSRHMHTYVELYRGKARQHTVSHLRPAHSYCFRLYAINENGAGPASAPVCHSTCHPAPPTPLPPRLTQPAEPYCLHIAWEAVIGAEAVYTLQLEDAEYGFRPVYTGAASEVCVADLVPNSAVRARLRVETLSGVSAWSECVVFRTFPLAPLPAYNLCPLSLRSGSRLLLRWIPPEHTDIAPCDGFLMQMCEVVPWAATTECAATTTTAAAVGLHHTAQEELVWKPVYEGTNTECTVGGLLPGTLYRFRVCCRGPGGLSAAVEVEARTDCVAPCLCPTVHVLHLHVTSCTLCVCAPRWTGGCPLLSYTAQLARTEDWSQENVGESCAGQPVAFTVPIDCACVDQSTGGVVYTVEQLTPGTRYRVRASAVNSVGVGPFTDWLEFVTAADTPLPPRDLLVTPLAAQTLAAQWSAPTSDNGAPITSYRVEWAAVIGSRWKHVTTVDADTRTCDIHSASMQANTRYRVRVSAANSAGWSAPSEAVTAQTLAAAPDQVCDVCVRVCVNEMHVTWRAPRQNGSDITQYNVEVTDVCAARLHAVVSVQTKAVCVDQLESDTRYSVRVQAVNAISEGMYSAAHVVRTHTQPRHPTLCVVGTSDTSVYLSWRFEGPVSMPSDLLHYTVQCEARYGGYYDIYRGKANTCKAGHLQEDSEYKFRISATFQFGESDYSVVSVRTKKKQVSKPVKVLNVREVCNSSVVLEWARMKQHLQSDIKELVEPLCYRLELASKSAASSKAMSDYSEVYTGTNTSHRLQGLHATSTYSARVCACKLSGAYTRYSAPFTFTVGSTHLTNSSLSIGQHRASLATSDTRKSSLDRHSSKTPTSSMSTAARESSAETRTAQLLLLAFGCFAFFVAYFLHKVFSASN